MPFRKIDDFDTQGKSYSPGKCAITNVPRQNAAPGKQPHEVDDFVLRGPEITFHDGRGDVSLGHFDVRPFAIAEAAQEFCGMLSPQASAELAERCEALEETVILLQTQVEEAEAFARAAEQRLVSRPEPEPVDTVRLTVERLFEEQDREVLKDVNKALGGTRLRTKPELAASITAWLYDEDPS